jgi:outer membrane lipoprotein-sorting protein
MRVKLSRRARWAVPAVAVVVAGGVIAGLQIPTAQASPALPARTPAQLLAQVSSDAKVPPLTGTVVETTSLGLPQLPQTHNPTSLSSLLTGSHTVKVYYQDAQHFRLAAPQSLSETDVIRNGNTLWLWESTRNTVTEVSWPKGALKHAVQQPPGIPALTPQQAADQVLKAVGRTTTVSVQASVLVAGEPAYQLVLAPKDSRSLIGRVMIAIDGKYGVPLRVQVFAKGAASPAFQVGYTELSFVAPAAANLTFTPPPGATVDKANLGAGHPGPRGGEPAIPSGYGSYGSDWLTVVSLPQKDLLSGFGTGSASSAPPASSPAGPGVLGGDSQEVLSALFGAAKPVQGPWGSGTLLRTSLVSVLMTGGEVYLGAVQPSVLYAAVGHTAAR